MLRMIEILKREDPSLALRAIIHSIQAASMSRVCYCIFGVIYQVHTLILLSPERPWAIHIPGHNDNAIFHNSYDHFGIAINIVTVLTLALDNTLYLAKQKPKY